MIFNTLTMIFILASMALISLVASYIAHKLTSLIKVKRKWQLWIYTPLFIILFSLGWSGLIQLLNMFS